MQDIVGIPSELIFSLIGALAILIRKQDLDGIKEKFVLNEKNVEKLQLLVKENHNAVQKGLSKEQLEEVVRVIKETLKYHHDHDKNNQTMMFNHFNTQLETIINKIGKK